MPFDPNSLSDLQTLRDELVNDPKALGYENGAADDSDAKDAALLVDRTQTDQAGDPFIVQKEEVAPEEIFAAIPYASGGGPTNTAGDWDVISQADRDYIRALMARGVRVPIEAGTNVRAVLLEIFPANSAARTALLAITSRQGSRLEALFGVGSTVTPSQVANARIS